jgi:hypothetical protein
VFVSAKISEFLIAFKSKVKISSNVAFTVLYNLLQHIETAEACRNY